MQEISNKPNFNDVILNLMKISDFTWGVYQFRRDILAKKIEWKDMEWMILSSIRCGIDIAEEIISKYKGRLSISELLDEFGIKLIRQEEELIGNRLLFARYTTPNEILIMEKPINKIVTYQEEVILQEEKIRDLILAHELFHHIEVKTPDIYTKKEEISLWKILFYTHKSTIPPLSEISAMSFSKKINQVEFSPCLLEVAMMYPYDELMGYKLYKEVIKIEKERERYIRQARINTIM